MAAISHAAAAAAGGQGMGLIIHLRIVREQAPPYWRARGCLCYFVGRHCAYICIIYKKTKLNRHLLAGKHQTATTITVAFFFAHSSLNEVERMQGPGQIHVVYLQREQCGKHVLVFMIDAEFISY